MSETSDLYQKIIMDHFRNPRGRVPFDKIRQDGWIEERNPSCGDVVRVRIQDGKAQFQAQACAISVASASILCEAFADDASQLKHHIEEATTLIEGALPPDESKFEGLKPLASVQAFPARKSCALLPWKAVKRALEGA